LYFIFHEDSQYTGAWEYCGVYKILRWLFKNRLYTNMLRIHLFSIFTIKTPRVYGYNCQSLYYEENAYKVVSKRMSAD